MATTPLTTNSESFSGRELHVQQVEDLIKLQKAAQKISSILDLDELIHKIVNDVVHSFGCVEANIYLFNEADGLLTLAGVCGCTVHDKGSRKKIGEGMTGHVAATGKTHYAPDVRVDPYYIACEPSTLSELAIPLHVEGKLVGVFSTSHHDIDAFSEPQIRLLQSLARHIAVAIHNAQRYAREKQERERMSRDAQEARAIQQALLPKASPFIPGFSISGVSIPAGEVGGDWYDFIPFDDGCWGLVLADVSGKGIAAALLMSATRAMLRSLTTTCGSPAETLSRLNRLMVEDFPPGRFVTLIYAVLDPTNRTLKFASAGHLPPVLIANDEARFLHSKEGLPLGLAKNDYSETELQMPTGSRLVLYSDGITEASAFDHEEYGAARLRDHVLQPQASSESILADVRRYADGAGLQDDATVIFVKA
jgi:sigma-B regulation protein RsbU (phosphoserine phosphatase)